MNAVNIEDLRRLARRRFPRVVFDYIDGGAERRRRCGKTARPSNASDFARATPSPNAPCNLRTTVLGQRRSSCRFCSRRSAAAVSSFHGANACRGCRRCRRNGIRPVDALRMPARRRARSIAMGPLWYQALSRRADATWPRPRSRARATQVSPRSSSRSTPRLRVCRERDLRNGAQGAHRRQARGDVAVSAATCRPSALALDFLRDGGMMKFPNVILPRPGRCAMQTSPPRSNIRPSRGTMSRGSATSWAGPIVVKGVQTAEDARHAIDAGADAVVVSNHGGRQLDGVAADDRALPEVVDAVGGRAEVFSTAAFVAARDIVKALCSRRAGRSCRTRVRLWTRRAAAARGRACDRDSAQRHRSHASLTRMSRCRRLDRSYLDVEFVAPMKLYVRGRLPLGGVAVVGSRQPPAQTREFAYHLAYVSANRSLPGLRRESTPPRIRGAIAAGVRRSLLWGMVSAAPIHPSTPTSKPPSSRQAARSPRCCLPERRSLRASRIARDRLQADHARAVVLVCSEIGGGAMYTMRFARELGRAALRGRAAAGGSTPSGMGRQSRMHPRRRVAHSIRRARGGRTIDRLGGGPSVTLLGLSSEATATQARGRKPRRSGEAADDDESPRRNGVSPATLQLLLRRIHLCD